MKQRYCSKLTPLLYAGLLLAAQAGVAVAQEARESQEAQAPAGGDNVVRVEAEQITGGQSVIRAEGDVQAHFNGYKLCAGVISYDRDTGVIRAEQNARLTLAGISVEADSARYSLADNSGDMQNFNKQLGDTRLRIAGDEAKWTRRALKAEDVSLTSCPATSLDWRFSGGEIESDLTTKRAIARDVVFRVAEVPIFYLPYGAFYYGDDPHSGFLWGAVQVGENDTGGKLPYYFALADNYDLTITPEFRAGHGLEMGGEFRFLTRHSRGDINIATALGDDESRGYEKINYWLGSADNGDNGGGDNTGNDDVDIGADGGWRFHAQLENTSDNDYLQDYGSGNEKSLRNHIRAATFYYERERVSAKASVEDYKTLDDNLRAPHRVFPRLFAAYHSGGEQYDWDIAARYANFRHADDETDGVSGERGVLSGNAAAYYHFNDILISPGVGFQAASYKGTENGSNGAYIAPYTRLDVKQSRQLPPAWAAPGDGLTGRLQLHGAFIYSPTRLRQNRLPLYDTTQRNRISENISEWNRFIGYDRAGDIKSLSYGGNYYVLSAGKEQLYIGAVQRFNIQAANITLSGEPPPTKGFGNVLVNSRLRLSDSWKVAADAEWNAEERKTERFFMEVKGALDGNAAGDRIVYARYLAEEDESLVFGAGSTLGDRLDIAFQADYLMNKDRFSHFKALIRLRDSCDCWSISAGVADSTTQQGNNETVFSLGFELTGLGGAGDAYDDLLDDLR